MAEYTICKNPHPRNLSQKEGEYFCSKECLKHYKNVTKYKVC